MLLVVILIGIFLQSYFTTEPTSSTRSASTPVVLDKPKYDLNFDLAYAPTESKSKRISSSEKDKLIELLKGRNFDELERRFEKVALQYENGEIKEYLLDDYLDSFNLIDPSLTVPLLDWAESKESWAAKMTASRYFNTLSWEWRGKDFWRKVPQENRDQYKKFQAVATKLAHDAQTGSKRDSLWYTDQIGYAIQGSGKDELALIEEGISQFPSSVAIYNVAIHSQQSNWGGDEFFRQKLIYDVAKLLDKAQYDGGATIHSYRGIDASANNETTAAVKSVRTALALNPNRYYYYRNLAKYLKAEAQFEESLSAVNVAIRLNPVEFRSLLLRANIYLEMGLANKAIPDIETLLKYSPYSKEVNVIASKAYGMLGQTKKAKKSLLNAEYFVKHNSTELVRLGFNAEHEIGDAKLAESYYLRAEKTNPLSAGAHYNLSTMYGDQQNCKIADYLFKYINSCRTEGDKHWCASERINWAYSAVNFLKGHQRCPNINDYDFSGI